MRARLVRLEQEGLVVKPWMGAPCHLFYEEILTAERLAGPRGLRLHMRATEAVRVPCRGLRRRELEDKLRFCGVRIVDCWGAIIAPTLLDFEEELDREPTPVRQSSDNA